MKHRGKAIQAGLRVIGWTLLGLIAVTLIGVVAALVGAVVAAVAGFLFGAWLLFALACLWFFRDPEPEVPVGGGLYVSPAHGKVDVIDEVAEQEFVGRECRRISIFLSVLDVHVQKAPISARVACVRHQPGRFLNAMRLEAAAENENVLVGLESLETPGEKVAVRLIAGLIARRIVPWATTGDEVARGERISLIQFGSRVEVYLPKDVRVQVQIGDRVRGGETVLAVRG